MQKHNNSNKNNMKNLTFADETILKHLKYCNKVQKGFYKVDNNQFEYKIGTVVATNIGSIKDVIGVIYGYIYCPITKQNRAVLNVNCDVSLNNIVLADRKQELAFNLFTKDFAPIEKRLTLLL